jgi:hypothetical protein
LSLITWALEGYSDSLLVTAVPNSRSEMSYILNCLFKTKIITNVYDNNCHVLGLLHSKNHHVIFSVKTIIYFEIKCCSSLNMIKTLFYKNVKWIVAIYPYIVTLQLHCVASPPDIGTLEVGGKTNVKSNASYFPYILRFADKLSFVIPKIIMLFSLWKQ